MLSITAVKPTVRHQFVPFGLAKVRKIALSNDY
jgi:hypothetical protein